MTFSTLAEYFKRLDATPKRLEITAILVKLIKKASVDEVDKILYLAAGRLGPLFANEDFNIADKMMFRVLAVAYNKTPAEIARLYQKSGDLGDVVSSFVGARHAVPLPTTDVYQTLFQIASDGGSGSQDRKVQAFATLLKKTDPLSTKYLVRIPLGKLRLGFSDLTVLDALSFVEVGDKTARAAIERAYNVYPDIGRIAKTLRSDGLPGLKKIKLTAGVPVLPQRCSLVTNAEEMLEKSKDWAVQPKYDGLRVQIHYGVKNKPQPIIQPSLIAPISPSAPTNIKIFSRGLEDITASMPEISKATSQLVALSSSGKRLVRPGDPVTNFILDGEAISVDAKTGKLLAFDETVTRKRKHGVTQKSEETPLKVFIFDLLLLNNEDLTNQPYATRYEKLKNLLSSSSSSSPLSLTPSKILSDPEAISKLFKEETSQGLEGIVAKKPDSPYAAGARNFAWVKMKRELNRVGALHEAPALTDTIDCVVLGYYFGEGKRNKFGIGAFLVGLYDDKEDVFKTVAKIGTGLTDEQWRELKKKCDAIKLTKTSPRVITAAALIPHINIDPKIVVAIRADQVTKSPLHTSGYSLRFPRLISYREKLPEDANTIKDIEKLFSKM